MADLLPQWRSSKSIDYSAILNAYQKVLYWLPRIQFEGHFGLDYAFCFRDQVLNYKVFIRDTEYFKRCFWSVFAGHYPVSDGINQDLENLVVHLEEVERKTFVYYDFQSRNIMWKDQEPFFIDYQMGCRGAIHYDLASLLYASASGLNDELRNLLIDFYLEELNPRLRLSRTEFFKDFYHFVLIRRLRSLGTYGFLSAKKGKLRFLEGVPKTIHEIFELLDNRIELKSFHYLKSLFNDWKQDENLCRVSSLYQKIEGSP
ncbi:MAG: phosphotransferase [SAR324 cluster bacterium]|nr:phosphotransferase [SAR324 cluster bacterium]